MKSKTKAILIDILGFGLIIAAAPIGWLPGPGGIAVLILGLSLLANNHEWAERLMNRVKHKSAAASRKFSEASPRTKWIIDITSVVFIIVAAVLITQFTQSLLVTSGISFIIAGVLMAATNQNRYKKVWDKFKRKH